MPAKNSIKQLHPESYYHIYNRGAHKQAIFHSNDDKKYFLSLVDRYLNQQNNTTDVNGDDYPKYNENLELLSYCLMGNHYHLLLYVGSDPKAMPLFIKSVMTAYVMYFNKKYDHPGTIFQGVYKASRITNDAYLTHISRYIHLNPRYYKTYSYSSLKFYTGKHEPPIWLKPRRILELFDGDYASFVDDYTDHKAWLEEIHNDLADK